MSGTGKWRMLAMAGVAMVTLAGTGARGEEAAETDKPLCMATEARRSSERLAALPSEPGPHIEKIKAMGDNEWLDLGAPAPDPKWGLRRGTSFTPRMVFAPEMRGAFVFGEGPHAGENRPDIMTDLYFYDINAHAWICASPPFQWKTQTLTVDENGFEVDETGQPLPYTLSHGWQNYTYDHDARQFLSVHSGCPFSRKVMSERRKAWTEGATLAAGGHPWFWDVATGRWERRVTTGDVPRLKGYNHVLQYVSSMKSTFYFITHTDRHGVFRYDNATDDWTRVGGIPRVRHGHGGYGSSGTVCLDTKRNRMVFSGAARAYDLAKDEWTDLADSAIWHQFSGVTRSTLTYDAASDVVVAFRYHMRARDGKNYVRIYDPEADAWLEETLEGPPNRGGRVPYAQYNAFYDPELNAHFMYAAGDGFNHRVKMWVYRYKRREQ